MGRVSRAVFFAILLIAVMAISAHADTDLDGYQIGNYDGWNDYTWNYGYGDSGNGDNNSGGNGGGGGWDTGMGMPPEWS